MGCRWPGFGSGAAGSLWGRWGTPWAGPAAPSVDSPAGHHQAPQPCMWYLCLCENNLKKGQKNTWELVAEIKKQTQTRSSSTNTKGRGGGREEVLQVTEQRVPCSPWETPWCSRCPHCSPLSRWIFPEGYFMWRAHAAVRNRARRKEQEREAVRVSLQPPSPIHPPLRCLVGRGVGCEGVKLSLWKLGLCVYERKVFCLCFLLSNSILIDNKLNYFSPVGFVLPVRVHGTWSTCLHLNPWAFPSCFLPMFFWEGGVWQQLGGPRLTYHNDLVLLISYKTKFNGFFLVLSFSDAPFRIKPSTWLKNNNPHFCYSFPSLVKWKLNLGDICLVRQLLCRVSCWAGLSHCEWATF